MIENEFGFLTHMAILMFFLVLIALTAVGILVLKIGLDDRKIMDLIRNKEFRENYFSEFRSFLAIYESIDILEDERFNKETHARENYHILKRFHTLYDEDKTYAPLLVKYEETFKVIKRTLKDAKSKDLLGSQEIQNEIFEILKAVMPEFNKMEELIQKNDELLKNNEIKILSNALRREKKILDDIKEMHKAKGV